MKDLHSFLLEETIHVTAERVWDLSFNRFGEVHLYNPNLAGSHYLKGEQGSLDCERHCSLDDKTFVQERIIEVEDGESFTIEIFNGNFPMVQQMFARHEFVPQTAGQTKVRLTTYYSTRPGFMAYLMKPMMKKLLKKYLVGMKYYLETGKPVSKKTYSQVSRLYRRLEAGRSFAA